MNTELMSAIINYPAQYKAIDVVDLSILELPTQPETLCDLSDDEIKDDEYNFYEFYDKNKEEEVNFEVSDTFELTYDTLSMLDNETAELLQNMQNASKELDKIISIQTDRNKRKNSTLRKLNFYTANSAEISTELLEHSIALNILKDFYSNFKESAQQLLENDLNTLVNQYLDNDYVFKFVSKVARNRITYNLAILNRRGAIHMVIGGAGRQLIGIIIDIAILLQKGSTFLFLDEAFNSFGVVEIQQMKDFIESATEMQFVLVEHKPELQGILDYPKIYINRTNKTGAYIVKMEDYNNELANALAYIEDALSRCYDDKGNAFRLILDSNNNVTQYQPII